MKKNISLIFSGIIGGLIVLSGSYFFNSESTENYNQSPKAVLTSSTSTEAPFDFVYAAEKVTPAVVHIIAEESRALAQQRRQDNKRSSPDVFGFEDFFGRNFHSPKNGTGSGVIISEEGYIVTNNHVVEYADIIKVSLADKRTFNATKIGTDPSTDLALLKIEANDLTAANFSNSDDVKVGEWVAAIGNPFSYLESTVTAGIVSAKGRDIDIIKNDKSIEEFIQTDAAINPGNSGGALVNLEGELIGINTAIATPTGVYAGYSFAIPSNLVLRIVDDIKQNGNIERGRLGVRGLTLNNEIVKELNLKSDKGFYVEQVDTGSGAQFAGVLPGDIIIRANNQRINSFEDLYGIVEFAKAGDTIKLGILRKNKELELSVNLRKGI